MSEYSVKEQYRIVEELYQFLSENKVFGVDEYVKLSNKVGSGMMSKLRLSPCKDLELRLSHLFALVKCAAMVEPISDDQVLVSIENQNPSYKFDCDLILEISGVLFLIDYTSSNDHDIIKEKERILNNKRCDPSLQGRMTDIMVVQFAPVKFESQFEWFCREPSLESPETFTLAILEEMSAHSISTNSKFIDQCKRVKDHAARRLVESDYKHSNYSSSKSNSDKVKLATAAASSNSLTDIVSLVRNTTKKQYSPFIDTLRTLSAQFHDVKQPFVHRLADLASSDETLDSILSKLSDDPLARVLHYASVTGKISGVKRNGKVDSLLSFPLGRSNKRMLSADSDYLIVAKHISGHYFKIIFAYEAMDDQLRRTIAGTTYPSVQVPRGTKSNIDECVDRIISSERELNSSSKVINKSISRKSHSTIWDKIITICNASKIDTGNVGIIANNLLSSTAFSLGKIVGGQLVSHQYEITKTFSTSIKNSHKDETYYVGVNGPYVSVTVTKMSATQDSFDRLHYSVISRWTGDTSYEKICWKKHRTSKQTSRAQFRTLDTNEVAYQLRVPYYIASLLTWDIETSLDKGRLNTSLLPEKITSSILHTVVNRDTFAQAAQQVRYLYMSSIGFGADASKISDKIDFFIPRYSWEFTYIVRMIKMGLSLSVLRDNDALSSISEMGELKVVFPHTTSCAQSFSQVVSSMYYCNIFNKFRAFHEVSEAFCFNELDDELDIYNECRLKTPLFLAGFSMQTINNYSNLDYLLSEEFVVNESRHVDNLLSAGAGRFRASGPIVIACSNEFVKVNDGHVANIYSNLGKSPIEACTLRGSMERGKASDKSQGCRAASAILEELMSQYEIDPIKLNSNSWLHSVFMDKIEDTGGDASIFSLVVNQLADDTLEYIYRIVQKDQIGNREISVLNAVFRLGSLFVETISKVLSDCIRDVDLLEDKDKDYVFETAVKNSIDKNKKQQDTLCFDNSDQKRWGPNHQLNIFACMFYGILYKERGLLRIIYFVADKVLQKKAKFPESLIKLFTKYVESNNDHTKITREGLNDNHGSDQLKKFYSTNSNSLFDNVFSKMLPYGMCQGIFHSTSSIYHAIMCKFIESLVITVFKGAVTIKSFCTSDDASRIIRIDKRLPRVQTIMRIHAVVIECGILFNVLRNDSKSAFNFFIAEFNSIFFKNGIMATPAIKQRISKIDVGSGQNHVEDYMSALSSSANYFTTGGSYVGSCILSIINITLHTEQWSRWHLTSPGKYDLPVELNGFPVIEPFTTCLSGAVANLYLRASPYVTEEQYAIIFSNIITEKPEEFKLSDYFRVPKSISEDSTRIKIFKNSGALGLHSLLRTDKKLSQFERRHHMSQWKFPDHFLSLRHNASDSRFFLYNIYKQGCMSLYSDSLGVNSFFKRFTDPWVSRSRKCVRISKLSILTILGLEPDVKYSYHDIETAFGPITQKNAREKMLELTKVSGVSEFTKNLVQQIVPRFSDASEIVKFLLSQECSDYITPRFTPATSRITLRGHEALDREKYTADLLKVLSGDSARFIIHDLYNDHRRFDQLPTAVDCPNMPLKDAILVAENSIHAFNKYIKRNTKMITSGKPDNLASLVTMVLKSRFFEGVGVRLTGNLKLIGDRSHAFSYTSWVKTLNEKSRERSKEFINQNCVQSYADVVKYGIISTNRVLTQKDHFEVIDTSLDKKHVKISAKSRSSLTSFVKTWLSANCDYSFDYETLLCLFRKQLLSGNEFRVNEQTFVRFAGTTYIDASANNLPCIHLIQTDLVQDRPRFKHVFLTESDSDSLEISSELTEIGANREWARALRLSMQLRGSHRSGIKYFSHDVLDTYEFQSINTSTIFNLDVCFNSCTIALYTDSYWLPICHDDAKTIKDMRLGHSIGHNDILDAVRKYDFILTSTEEFKQVSKTMSSVLNFVIYKTSIHSKIGYVNDIIKRIGSSIEFKSIKELDVLRSLLLSDNQTTKTVNTNRLYNYINNLFRSPDYREGFLLNVNVEEEVGFALSDNYESGEDDAEYEDYKDELTLDQNTDSSSDSDSIVVGDFLEEFDDIEFEGAEEDDLIDANENIFQAFDISVSLDDDDAVSIKTSRTGLTVNPNNEFPYGILKFLQTWQRKNTLKHIRGITNINSTVLDIAGAYLSSIRSSGSVRGDMIQLLTGSDEINLPISMSDLVIIRSVLA